MKTRLITILSIVAIVAWIAVTLFKNKQELNSKNQVVDRSKVAVPVSIYNIAATPLNGKFTLPAVVDPANEASIIATTPGKLENLKITLGNYVGKGQLVGSIDSRLKEINLRTTELSVSKLEKDYLRNQELFKGNAITEVALTDSKYNFENARMQAEQIRQQIADARILAPINGVVTKKNFEAGEYVNAGTAIATVVDISQLKAVVTVNEKDVYRIKVGQAVGIRNDVFPDKVYNGVIEYISPRGDANHNYEVQVTVNNRKEASLKAGSYVRVEFDSKETGNVIQIPKLALVEGMKNPYVFVIEDGKAVSKKVTVGREFGENVEVIDGLNAGESVVVNGQVNLSEGNLVEIIKD